MSARTIHRAPMPAGLLYACDVRGCAALATVCWRRIELSESWSTPSAAGPLRVTCAAHVERRRAA